MTNERLYRIEEKCPTTEEWSLIDENSKGLTKQQCDEKLELHMRNEVNPNYLRVIREQ
jgi:hypothetical protein